jgi:hypothetical protein
MHGLFLPGLATNLQEVKQQPGHLLELYRQMKVCPCVSLPKSNATFNTVHPGFLYALQTHQAAKLMDKRKEQDAAVAAPPPVATAGAPQRNKAGKARRRNGMFERLASTPGLGTLIMVGFSL